VKKRVHRESLAYLKSWDTCVFPNQRNKRRKKQKLNDGSYLNFGGFDNPSRDQEDEDWRDEFGRPKEKVTYLCYLSNSLQILYRHSYSVVPLDLVKRPSRTLWQKKQATRYSKSTQGVPLFLLNLQTSHSKPATIVPPRPSRTFSSTPSPHDRSLSLPLNHQIS
jgi:hypothetical protein